MGLHSDYRHRSGELAFNLGHCKFVSQAELTQNWVGEALLNICLISKGVVMGVVVGVATVLSLKGNI